MGKRLTGVLPILCAMLACGQAPVEPGNPALLPQLMPAGGFAGTLETVQQQGPVEVEATVSHRIRVGNSERTSVLTTDGLSWRAALPAGGATHLELAVAAVGRPGSVSEAVLWLQRGAGRRTLLETGLRPAEGWQQHRVELGPLGDAPATLVLESRGPQPVAWAGLYLDGGPAPSRPDLVLVLIDTLRADHLSCQGYPRPTTPNLDRLAAEAHRFERCLAASTWTLPSTATLLTGQMPGRHRLVSIEDRLGDEVTTLAEQLRAAGYRTVAFTDGGFLRWDWGFAQGFDRYDCTPGAAWEPKDVAMVADAAIGWMRSSCSQPFFMLLHTYETHQPYTQRPGFTERFLDPGDRVEEGTSIEAWELLRHRDDPALLRRVLALYDGEVARADHHVGRVLEELRSSGRFDGSAIVVTSDHGEEFLEHGGVEHGAGKVFDENVRVPLIIKPPHCGTPVVHAEPVSSRHVAATLLGLAGVEPAGGMDGSSLLGPAANRDEVLLVEGRNSFPQLNEVRYRLDRGLSSLVFDAVRQTLRAFDREGDPGMRHPAAVDPGDALARRLQVMLAARSPQGELLVRLPEGTDQVAIPPGSTVVPRGLWEDLSWRSLAGAGPHPVAAGASGILLVDIEDGPGLPVLELGRERRVETLQLPETATGDDWLFGPILPGPLEAMPAVRPAATVEQELSASEREELRALGYLE